MLKNLLESLLGGIGVPLLVLLMAGWLLPSVGHAEADSEEEERFDGSIRLLLLIEPEPSREGPPPVPVFHLFLEDEEAASVEFADLDWQEVSDSSRISGPRVLRFFRGSDLAEAGFVGQVRMPAEDGKWLLVFLPVAGGDLAIVPVRIDASAWPAGHVLFSNFGDEPVAAEVGGEVNQLDPGDTWLVENELAENFQLRAQVAAQHGDRLRLVYRSSFAIGPDSRLLFIIHRRGIVSGPWTVSTFAGFQDA